MIDFPAGIIELGDGTSFSVLNFERLNALTETGIVERREHPGGTYYYLETMDCGMTFGGFISLRKKMIDSLALRWLDGPCTSKGWDEVSEKALKDEYRTLCQFVENKVGRPPDKKGNMNRAWHFGWGQVNVSYQPRDFVTQIYMKPMAPQNY